MKKKSKTLKKTKGVACALDKRIGQRIKEQRILKGLNQTELGEKIGVTFQQIQKYERGKNRVSAVNLIKICAAFDMTPDMFLIGLLGDI